MNTSISAISPYSDPITAPFRSAPESGPTALAGGPAATVEISSEARAASSTGLGPAADALRRPLNIIWGNGPK